MTNQQLSFQGYLTLPHDVLRLICSFIPLYPRVRVISTLSKRWRSAALSSIDTLEDIWPASAIKLALPQLPALRHHLVGSIIAPYVRTSLLSLCVIDESLCCCMTALKHTSLTALDFPHCCEYLFQVLNANRSSLTSVVVRDGTIVFSGLSLDSILAARNKLGWLPNLRSLESHGPRLPLSITLHCSQLTSLDVTMDAELLAPDIEFRSLKTLVLGAPSTFELSAMLAKCPVLHDLALRYRYPHTGPNLSDAEPFLIAVPFLTSLHTPHEWEDIADRVAIFTRLKHLTLECGHFRNHDNLRTLVDRLESFSATFNVGEEEVLCGNTSLRSLTFRQSMLPSSFDYVSGQYRLDLPNLRDCVLRLGKDPAVVLGILTDVITSCPKLRALTVVASCSLEKHKQELVSLLRLAEQRGLETFVAQEGSKVRSLAKELSWTAIQEKKKPV